jgi:UDP-N-acetylmuramoyl-tripeptide--D-alanyl-D-alanine ligase
MIKSVLHPLFLQHSVICTDTRAIVKNSLFFALKGENFNANIFAKEAIDKGASYAIIDDQEYLHDERFILVDDVLETLQKLALFHRKYLGIPIIALTGSNGKTTTKELLHSVLKKKYNVLATKGNLNNHIGVPLTLLSMDKNTELAVIELGANHPNEIKFLSNIAQPNYGLITNFGKAHLEGFGSIEGVVKAKTELYQNIKENDGIVFVNASDNIQMEKSSQIERITIGKKDADIIVQLVSAAPNVIVNFDNMIINSNMIGAYNFSNIAFAIGVGEFFKVKLNDIKKAIESYIPSNNRSQTINKGSNTILLDAYNANPSSMKAALDNFINLSALKKIVILGDMFELGDFSQKEHQFVVDFLKDVNTFEKVILLGENFFKTNSSSSKFMKYKDILTFIKEENIEEIKNSYILIKGSRGMQLEKLLEYFSNK